MCDFVFVQVGVETEDHRGALTAREFGEGHPELVLRLDVGESGLRLTTGGSRRLGVDVGAGGLLTPMMADAQVGDGAP